MKHVTSETSRKYRILGKYNNPEKKGFDTKAEARKWAKRNLRGRWRVVPYADI